ncbi:MAG: hypothetical protein WBL19_02785 [Minisyncoccia bacterium]
MIRLEKIQYPYLPLGREILYVPLGNKYMFNALLVGQRAFG